jgi:hypothetical protein
MAGSASGKAIFLAVAPCKFALRSPRRGLLMSQLQRPSRSTRAGRSSAHSIDMWEYTITANGLVIGEPLRGYRALTSGIPGPARTVLIH